ncbi:hypothetical protein Dimus_021124 [Dionaea muscipula]
MMKVLARKGAAARHPELRCSAPLRCSPSAPLAAGAHDRLAAWRPAARSFMKLRCWKPEAEEVGCFGIARMDLLILGLR